MWCWSEVDLPTEVLSEDVISAEQTKDTAVMDLLAQDDSVLTSTKAVLLVEGTASLRHDPRADTDLDVMEQVLDDVNHSLGRIERDIQAQPEFAIAQEIELNGDLTDQEIESTGLGPAIKAQAHKEKDLAEISRSSVLISADTEPEKFSEFEVTVSAESQSQESLVSIEPSPGSRLISSGSSLRSDPKVDQAADFSQKMEILQLISNQNPQNLQDNLLKDDMPEKTGE